MPLIWWYCIVCLMSVTYLSSLILNTIICCLVSIPYKQCNSTKAGMQHSHLCNPPPRRLFESVWGTWIQQLCSHQRWCPGLWQTEAVHLCVSTLPDKRYVVTGYNRLQVKDGWNLLVWKMKSIKSSLKSAFFVIASRVLLTAQKIYSMHYKVYVKNIQFTRCIIWLV